MAASDLVAIADLKAWLNITDPGKDDVLLAREITAISRAILVNCNRRAFLPQTFAEVRDGNDGQRMLLREWPVQSVQSLAVNGTAIPVAPPLSAGVPSTSGYFFEAPEAEPPGAPQNIMVRGYVFCRGMQNIAVSYVAGYQITAEAMVANSSAAVAVAAPFGPWGSDAGLTYVSSGAALAKVAANPTTGQYSVSAGKYTFAAGDNGVAMLVTYGYIPADLSNVAMEWAAERYKYRDRIGQASKSLGGQETTSFQPNKMPQFVADVVQQYAAVASF